MLIQIRRSIIKHLTADIVLRLRFKPFVPLWLSLLIISELVALWISQVVHSRGRLLPYMVHREVELISFDGFPIIRLMTLAQTVTFIG